MTPLHSTATSAAHAPPVSPSPIALRRQRVLALANALFSGPQSIPFIEQYDAVPQLSALLATALQDLKAADEEFARERAAFEEARGVVEQRALHYEQLFEHAPAAMFVTDVYGTIREVNRAAVQLMKRDVEHLRHKSMAALMPAADRPAFRDRLKRISIAASVDDWRFTLQRAADLPIDVTAAVRLAPGIGHTGNGVLQWLVRPLDATARSERRVRD